MSIPLVQNNEKDSINTSIIAIKRNIERINMLLGLSNSEEIDTSKFATKEELQQAVTDLQPVDEVAVDNMHSVTSNAVAKLFSANIDNTKFTLTTTNQQAQYTGLLYCVIQQNTTNNVIIYEDDAELLVDDRGGEYSYNHS